MPPPAPTDRRKIMAEKKPIHTVPKGRGWANVREGSNRALSAADTKAAAQAAGRERAKGDKVEDMIHKKDGIIGEGNSYGNDPRSIPG
jgi:hypothetical protein